MAYDLKKEFSLKFTLKKISKEMPDGTIKIQASPGENDYKGQKLPKTIFAYGYFLSPYVGDDYTCKAEFRLSERMGYYLVLKGMPEIVLPGAEKEIIKYINDLKEKEGIDYIRLRCVSNQDTQNTLELLKEYYRLDKTVKFKLEKEKSMDIRSMDEHSKTLYDQYSYFFNRSMSPYDILARYINESQSEVIVTADQIINALKEV